MAGQNVDPDAAVSTPTSSPNSASTEPYTGVVLIHGLGDIQRNTTLQEALNTLAYWFNHEAGLELRREGTGRMWLAAHLMDDPNPDAEAASATLDLAAPGRMAVPPESGAPLRLEFREVWWAESFGLPSVSATIGWAQVQFREQAANLLLLFGKHRRREGKAVRAPATSGPVAERVSDASPPAGEPESGAGSAKVILTSSERTVLRGLLRLYGLVQYVWKALQWLILAPLILLLLLVMGPIRLLALIPPLRTTVIGGLSALLERIMLHWIAQAQVYTLDYTRSAGIRERFEREVATFLRDEQCGRIVVIAHSMGTVIAYEGLTTTLSQGDPQERPKPVTFICLGQALRRVWLMAADDPHRLHGVLPNYVRWLHFWARYDPVTAGPLTPGSLPRLEPFPSSAAADPSEKLRASLERCENVRVVNTDSTFTDHTTYWRNVEQVVGPIALELVTDQPALEHVVQAHLATSDEVLLHRWRVAWRATVALAGGLAAGIGLFVRDQQNSWAVGHNVVMFFGSSFASGAVNGLCNICGAVGQATHTSVSFPDPLASFVVAVVCVGIGVPLISLLVAPPSPYAFQDVSDNGRGRWGVFTLSLVAIVLVALLLLMLLFTGYLAPSFYDYLYRPAIGIAALAFFPVLAAWILVLIDSWIHRRWFWFAVTLLLSVPAFTVVGADISGLFPEDIVRLLRPSVPNLNLSSAQQIVRDAIHFLPSQLYVDIPADALFIGGLVATVGLSLILFDAARQRHWSQLARLLVSVPFLLVAFGMIDLLSSVLGQGDVGAYAFNFLIIPAALTATFLYGLWSGLATGTRGRFQGNVSTGSILVLSSISLALVALDDTHTCSQIAYDQCFVAQGVSILAGLGGLVAGAAGLLVLVEIVRHRQWGWFAVLPAIVLVMIYRWGFHESSILSYYAQPPTPVYLEPVDYGALFYRGLWLAILAATLCYGLWAPTRAIPTMPGAGLRSIKAVVSIIPGVSVMILLVALVLVFPPIPDNHQLDQTILQQPPALSIDEFVLPHPGSDPVNIVAGPDGNIWFTEYFGNRIGRITPNGTLTEFSLSTSGERPDAITAGPDGNVWFTEDIGKIGRITPVGDPVTIQKSIREFPLPTKGEPFGITAGSDGNLWFVENVGKIGRITPADDPAAIQKSIKEFPVANSLLIAITSGPDGNLWFTDAGLGAGAGKIGRITPAADPVTIQKSIREFPLPTTADPYEITSGPDGNLWFTDTGTGKIGEITVAGKPLPELPSGHSLGEVEQITTGPDSNLWFTEGFNNQIGSINPLTGQVMEWPMVRLGISPLGIAVAGDGNLWFTEAGGNAIARWQNPP